MKTESTKIRARLSFEAILWGIIAYCCLWIAFNALVTTTLYVAMKFDQFDMMDYSLNESFLYFLSLFLVNFPTGFVVGFFAKKEKITNCIACSLLLAFIEISHYSYSFSAYLNECMLALYSDNEIERFSFPTQNSNSFYWLYFTFFVPAILLGGFFSRRTPVESKNTEETDV